MELRPLGWTNPRPDRVESYPSVDITHLRRIELVTPEPAEADDEHQTVACRRAPSVISLTHPRARGEGYTHLSG